MLIKYVYDESVREIVQIAKDERGRTWARLGRGKKIGVVVALGPNQIGYSVCRYPDTFDRATAISLAISRADGTIPITYISSKAKKAYKWMQNKVKNYHFN